MKIQAITNCFGDYGTLGSKVICLGYLFGRLVWCSNEPRGRRIGFTPIVTLPIIPISVSNRTLNIYKKKDLWLLSNLRGVWHYQILIGKIPEVVRLCQGPFHIRILQQFGKN